VASALAYPFQMLTVVAGAETDEVCLGRGRTSQGVGTRWRISRSMGWAKAAAWAM